MLRAIRSALIPITMPLAVIAGLPVLLLTGSRRKAINFCTGLWADVCCALIGIQVEIEGADYLQSPRPVVFILNHQSNADGFLVAKLIRRDIAFMGKAELSRQVVRSRLMQMGGLIMVDRKDASKASAAMQMMISAIRNRGLSAAIFPEGRRSQSLALGPFRKGAFLTAMRAKVPIVPLVIHNSIDAQPRGEKHYRPANIRVDVLPPIDVSQWKMKAIDQHVAEVRAMYLKLLGQEEKCP